MMGAPDLPRHAIDLGAIFPGVALPCVFDPGRGLLWFPMATVCALLELDVRSQRRAAQRDFAAYLDSFRLDTAGGPQTLLCIEYEALALWIAGAQEGKASPPAQQRLRHFKRLVMAGATDILTGRATPMPIEERRKASRNAPASLLQEHDSRLAQLERAVFVGEPEDEANGTDGYCPHCGGAIRVEAVTLRIVKGE